MPQDLLRGVVDWFLEARYFLRPQSYVSLSAEDVTRKMTCENAGRFYGLIK